nr:zinc finger, CCHC-type [Tanacetum cinerariifolium]
MLVVRERGLRTKPKTKVDAIAWWIDSDATTHVYKDHSWFKTYETVEDESDFTLVMVISLLFMVYEFDKYILSKSGVFVGFGYYNNDDAFTFCYVCLLHAKDESLDKFRIYKTEVELQQNDLIKTLRMDRGGEYYDPVLFESVGIILETIAPYTPQQNGVAERKNIGIKEMVNFMLSYSGLSDGFWGEAMLTTCYLLNRVPNKRNKTTPYELWYKKRPNLSYLRVWDCRAVVRLSDPKRKTLGEKGYRFYVIEPNDSVSINSIIESKDAIFDENRFSSIPRSKDILPNLKESQRDDHSDDVPSETM